MWGSIKQEEHIIASVPQKGIPSAPGGTGIDGAQ